MKIYLGGIYHTRIATPGSRSIHLRMMERVRHPFVLESYHYTDAVMVAAIRRNGQKIFLDSGAYSADTQGVRIDLSSYADFIRRHHDIIEVAANLDLIGAEKECWSYQRQKALEGLLKPDGLDRLIVPVHHLGDDDKWLRRYLDEAYDYIALGGMVGQKQKRVRRWLDHVWQYYLTNPNGTPKLKVHGFGLTSPELMRRYPWHSVDSTSWVMASRYGGVMLDFHFPCGAIADYKIDFSERSSGRSWHYFSLGPVDRQLVDHRLEQLETGRIPDPEIEAAFKAEFGIKMGFNPQALAASYGLRDLCNIGYYRRAMTRAGETVG